LRAVAWHSFGSPCLSAFRPLYVTAGTQPDLASGGSTFDAASPWWLNERVQRRADLYPGLKPAVQMIWDGAEREAFAAVENVEAQYRRLLPSVARDELRRVSNDLVG